MTSPSRSAAWASLTHSPEFIDDATALGPNGVRFDSVAPHAQALALPSGQVSMYDSVNVAAMPSGAVAYAGYYNGTFANLTALRARFPGAEIVTITPNGAKGAMYGDVEPGDMVNSQIPGFLKGGGLGFYTSAGNLSAAIAECTAAGIPRSAYKVWSAHWTGRHICGPATCGHPQADGTQYVSTSGWDESVVNSPAFFGGSVTPPSPFPISVGATGAEVIALQQMLNKWAPAIGLSVALKDDGAFGPLTLAAVKLAQKYFGLSQTGSVDSALFSRLQGTPPPPAPPGVPAAPGHLSATPWLLMDASWGTVKDSSGKDITSYDYQVTAAGKIGTVIASGMVNGNHLAGLKLPYGGSYVWRVRAAAASGGGVWSPWKSFA